MYEKCIFLWEKYFHKLYNLLQSDYKILHILAGKYVDRR